jgi:hypothetical protein
LFKKSIELNPKYENPYQYVAVASLSMADYKSDHGEDTLPSLDESISAYKQSLILAPADSYSHAGLGIAFSKKAEVLLKRGDDPTADLKSARLELRKSLEGHDQLVATYSFFAEAELIAARYAITQVKSPESFFTEASRLLKAGLAVNADCSECHQTFGKLHLLRAEYLNSLHRAPEPEIVAGIDSANHALKVNPQMSDSLAIRGKLYLWRARLSGGVAQKKDAAKNAASSFEQAFKIRGALRKDYEKDYEESKRLAI